MQKLVVANAERYSKKHSINIDREWLILKLIEENGEFANALLVHTKKCRQEKIVDDALAKENLSKELADVFSTILLLADNLKIDLFKTLDEKVLQKGKQYLESQSEI